MNKLDAVNKILLKCGFGTVQALETGGASIAAFAERYLDNAAVEIQAEGWHFNTRSDLEIEPDGSDNIVLPDEAIVADSDAEDAYRDVSMEGRKLYDKDENTNEFTSSIQTEQVLNFNFGCIPFPIRNLIVCRAAVNFAAVYKPMERAIIRNVEMDYMKAKAEANRFESNSSDVNVLKTPEAMRMAGRRYGNYDVRRPE